MRGSTVVGVEGLERKVEWEENEIEVEILEGVGAWRVLAVWIKHEDAEMWRCGDVWSCLDGDREWRRCLQYKV